MNKVYVLSEEKQREVEKCVNLDFQYFHNKIIMLLFQVAMIRLADLIDFILYVNYILFNILYNFKINI